MKTISLGFALFLMSGCATIVQAGPDQIQIRSNPDKADVYLNGIKTGQTPTLITIRRMDDALIEIKKEGYQTLVIDKHKVVTGWFFGNLLLGGVFGMTIDLITHNQGKYSEDPILISLQPLKTDRAISSVTTPSP